MYGVSKQNGEMKAGSPSVARRVRRWFKSTSKRTFVVYPVAVIAFELGLRHGALTISPWGVPLLLWGYLQYRLVGTYRVRTGGTSRPGPPPPVRTRYVPTSRYCR